ncbi:unnamed protein product [Lymnaea stagnalis]|uniref:Sm domain-containing protein n=1 Tax=Lymnaea stagnalis TaxID=6523 RepID=A0AAV2HFX0_LYMST
MAVASARSKFHFYNSMTCLLTALEGKVITVEIRNDKVIEGILDLVEADMNLNMSNVVLTDVLGRSTRLTKFYIRGRQIRFVHIPDEVDIIKAMQWQIDKTEYYKGQERKDREKIMDRRQQLREKKSAQLQAREKRM